VRNFNLTRLDRSDLGFSGNTLTFLSEEGIPITIRDNSLSSSIDGSFTVTAGWTQQSPLSVDVSLSFSDVVREIITDTDLDIPSMDDPRALFEWQSGSITIQAADGSSIIVSPTQPNNQTFNLLLSNGESIGPIAWGGEHTIDCGSIDICPE